MAGILLTQQHANKMHISSVTNSQGTDILEPHLNKKMIKLKKIYLAFNQLTRINSKIRRHTQ